MFSLNWGATSSVSATFSPRWTERPIADWPILRIHANSTVLIPSPSFLTLWGGYCFSKKVYYVCLAYLEPVFWIGKSGKKAINGWTLLRIASSHFIAGG
jgi:hypothetical protein